LAPCLLPALLLLASRSVTLTTLLHFVPCSPACRSAIVLGSLVPLSMFLSWEAVALSLLPPGLSDAGSAAAAGSVLQASLQLAAGASASSALAVTSAVGGPAAAAAAAAAGALGGAAEAAASAAAAMPVATLADAPAALAIDPLEVFVRRSSPLIGSVVEGFSFLAVMTSFVGTTLSLSGAWGRLGWWAGRVSRRRGELAVCWLIA
jgi:hypothetical protein